MKRKSSEHVESGGGKKSFLNIRVAMNKADKCLESYTDGLPKEDTCLTL
jgi:hypothetical protein